MNDVLRGAVAEALGARIVRAGRVGGGDINDAYEVDLDDGRRVFVKANARAPAGMFRAEARGLAWLAEAETLPCPEVLAVGEGSGAAFLALQHLPAGRPGPGHDEALGRGLAALHRYGAPGFGLDHANFIGRLPQDNHPEPSWPSFYRRRRLEPQLRMAVDAGRASAAMGRGFERLFAHIEDRVGPPEPPARLHGDLWGGNLHTSSTGRPWLIDPAVYGGHREMDLAMMRLFGGFAPRVFDAYDEAWPLAPGWRERVPLYQLYPLMVHVNLFGGGYVASVEAALRKTGGSG